MSKLFISCNFIKLLKQSLHAQNAVRLRVLFPIFEVLCVIHREPPGGKVGGGSSGMCNTRTVTFHLVFNKEVLVIYILYKCLCQLVVIRDYLFVLFIHY
jgi:hypothetical protein